MAKIAYITAKTPFGRGETFILSEMQGLVRSGADLLIVPRGKSNELFNAGAGELVGNTLGLPLLDMEMIRELLVHLFRKPASLIRMIRDIAFRARSLRIACKNLIVLPKALYLSRKFGQMQIAHIHAHWASTTATMAYIISGVLKLPWSFTAHRWDIAEDNLLADKCRSASFVRVISEKGRAEIAEMIKEPALFHKIHVVHMGVPIPSSSSTPSGNQPRAILCPANLVDVKGHRYLLEACRILSDRHVEYDCIIAGDGPLQDRLLKLAEQLGLEDRVRFTGRLSHEKICSMYESGKIDVVVLPSIVTEKGEQEGIPVALIEAMSYGVPVVSTQTGGIPELIAGGGGIMVQQKSPEALAVAIENILNDRNLLIHVGGRGRERVSRDFNLGLISGQLRNLFASPQSRTDFS